MTCCRDSFNFFYLYPWLHKVLTKTRQCLKQKWSSIAVQCLLVVMEKRFVLRKLLSTSRDNSLVYVWQMISQPHTSLRSPESTRPSPANTNLIVRDFKPFYLYWNICSFFFCCISSGAFILFGFCWVSLIFLSLSNNKHVLFVTGWNRKANLHECKPCQFYRLQLTRDIIYFLKYHSSGSIIPVTFTYVGTEDFKFFCIVYNDIQTRHRGIDMGMGEW
jgi:hypothetical protein